MNILRINKQGNLELRLSIPLHPPENTGDEEQESLGGVTVTADSIEVAGLQSALAEAEAKLATAEKERDHWKNLGSSVEFMQRQNEFLGKANAGLIEELEESKQRVELLENNNTALNNNYEHAEKLIRTLCDALDISSVKWVETPKDTATTTCMQKKLSVNVPPLRRALVQSWKTARMIWQSSRLQPKMRYPSQKTTWVPLENGAPSNGRNSRCPSM